MSPRKARHILNLASVLIDLLLKIERENIQHSKSVDSLLKTIETIERDQKYYDPD